jgi:hypothetical protein
VFHQLYQGPHILAFRTKILEKVALRKEYFGPFAILVLVVCRQNGTTITLKKGMPEHITYMLENMVVSRIQHNIGTKARKIYIDRLNN